jgi:hypothetical protein
MITSRIPHCQRVTLDSAADFRPPGIWSSENISDDEAATLWSALVRVSRRTLDRLAEAPVSEAAQLSLLQNQRSLRGL